MKICKIWQHCYAGP